ncbi:MAG: ureidoglycolate lyase [Lysobacterales bacterium]
MNPAAPVDLEVEPLSRAAFAAFGEVIEASGASVRYPINQGSAMRFHALAQADCHSAGGTTLISIVRAEPRALPFTLRLLERHPLGSQAFVPLSAARYLIVVATSPTQRPRVFLADSGQGINFFRGTWHHPLLALDRESDFLVVDRGGPGENCEEQTLAQAWRIAVAAAAPIG